MAARRQWGTRAISHDHRTVKVRDLPAGDRPVVLVWRKRTRVCPADECPVKSFSEETDGIAPRACLTERARAAICWRVGKDGHSVAQAARDFALQPAHQTKLIANCEAPWDATYPSHDANLDGDKNYIGRVRGYPNSSKSFANRRVTRCTRSSV